MRVLKWKGFGRASYNKCSVQDKIYMRGDALPHHVLMISTHLEAAGVARCRSGSADDCCSSCLTACCSGRRACCNCTGWSRADATAGS